MTTDKAGLTALAEPELTLRHVEFDPLGWQLWSNDKGFQIAGFATRGGMMLHLDARATYHRSLASKEPTDG